jgi:hypothetical protein
MQRIGVKLGNKHWYELLPKLVETSHKEKVTIQWSQNVQIDRTIPYNKLGIIIRDNDKETCLLIMLQFQETKMCSRKKPRKF